MLFSSIRFLFPQISIVHRLSPPPPATALQTLNQPPSTSKRQSESCVLFPSKRRKHSYISVPDPLSWSQQDHPMTARMSPCLLSLSKTFFHGKRGQQQSKYHRCIYRKLPTGIYLAWSVHICHVHLLKARRINSRRYENFPLLCFVEQHGTSPEGIQKF